MRREEITAPRMGSVYRGGSRYIFISREGKELGLPPYLEYDKAFHAWMKAIPLLKRPPVKTKAAPVPGRTGAATVPSPTRGLGWGLLHVTATDRAGLLSECSFQAADHANLSP